MAHAPVTLGGSNPRSNKSNPPAVSRRRGLNATEGCGIVAPATNRAAESTYAKPRLARILWRPLFHRRRPISPAATTWAATGVRDSAGVGLQLAFERTEGTGGSYEAAGAHRATTRGGGARGHGARRPWRTAASGARGAAATGHAREREVRGKEEGLTADSQSRPVCSGTSCVRRIDGDGGEVDLRRRW